MGRYQPITLPPGTTLFFQTTPPDEFGNFEYTGSYLLIGPSGTPLPEPKPPSYASSPVYGVTKTKPAPVEPPGSKVFTENVRDGVNLFDGGVRKLSTGELVALDNSGWVNSEYVKKSDDVRATDYNAEAAEYGSILEAAGFDFSSIPADATIRGIKVRVERSKVPEANPPAPPGREMFIFLGGQSGGQIWTVAMDNPDEYLYTHLDLGLGTETLRQNGQCLGRDGYLYTSDWHNPGSHMYKIKVSTGEIILKSDPIGDGYLDFMVDIPLGILCCYTSGTDIYKAIVLSRDDFSVISGPYFVNDAVALRPHRGGLCHYQQYWPNNEIWSPIGAQYAANLFRVDYSSVITNGVGTGYEVTYANTFGNNQLSEDFQKTFFKEATEEFTFHHQYSNSPNQREGNLKPYSAGSSNIVLGSTTAEQMYMSYAAAVYDNDLYSRSPSSPRTMQKLSFINGPSSFDLFSGLDIQTESLSPLLVGFVV